MRTGSLGSRERKRKKKKKKNLGTRETPRDRTAARLLLTSILRWSCFAFQAFHDINARVLTTILFKEILPRLRLLFWVMT
ncbi:hypothetical protein V6N11_050116 [Hibiscus sabdariffa]|uniref:Uncharacterized protein n=1 Tax=Hibiscus sabdariffa TaxID=183260 RepID=A0ABR2T9C2_9ROSI